MLVDNLLRSITRYGALEKVRFFKISANHFVLALFFLVGRLASMLSVFSRAYTCVYK